MLTCGRKVHLQKLSCCSILWAFPLLVNSSTACDLRHSFLACSNGLGSLFACSAGCYLVKVCVDSKSLDFGVAKRVRNRETMRTIMAFILALVGMIFLSMDKLSAQVVSVNCTLSSSSMISPAACTYYDKQNMASQMGNCQPFLANLVASPDAGCCDGMNEMGYYRTACICDATFYPPATENFTRALQLANLCGVRTDLCAECPRFLVQRTEEFPAGGVEKRSRTAKVAAIVLGVILSVAMVGAAIIITITELKKRKQGKDKDTPEVFEAQPPGGAF